MANTDLIDTVLGRITAENLEMAHWAQSEAPEFEQDAETNYPMPTASCNTTMCFAGHTVVAAGEAIKWEPRSRWNPLTGRYEVYRWSADYTTKGDLIEARAQELLELDTESAHAIFHATDIGSDVDRLERHVTNVLVKGHRETYEMYEDDEL